jgi:hypothetical protein
LPSLQAVTGTTSVNADGTFQITGVIPGVYTLMASARQNNTQWTAVQRLDVGYGGNVSGLTLALRSGIGMNGQFYLDGPAPADFQIQSIRVRLNPVDDLSNRPAAPQARVNPDGSFLVPDVVVGTQYRLSVDNIGNGGYLMAGLYGGANALNGALDVQSEGIAIQLQLGFSPGRVEAVVLDRDQPVPGALAVLVPRERGRIDLYRTANAGADGRVSFANVPPGDYKLFAWEDVLQGAWQDTRYMERFEDKGSPIRIEKAGTVTATLQIIKQAG